MRWSPMRLAGESQMRQYIALIHKEADSDYGVSFPDLPGVITAGSNLDEARKLATEALAFHLAGLAEDGEPAPEPSSLDEVMSVRENKDGVAVLIAAPDADVKSVRINVTMPADLRARSSRASVAIEALFAARKKPMTFIVVCTGTTNSSSETTIVQATPASAPQDSRARRVDSSVVSLAVLKINCPPGPSAIDFDFRPDT